MPAELTQKILTSLPGNVWENLQQADQRWHQLRNPTATQTIASVIQTSPESLGETNWDVVIAGGTLGILLGCALVQKGWRVAVIERGALRGRAQEWNISRRELQVLVDLEILTETELQTAIASEFNPVRIQFAGGEPVWVRNVLNIGVNPVQLLDLLKQHFLEQGGQILEYTAFEGATIHPDGVMVQAGATRLTTRLLLDALGHFSPIARQARQGERLDAVCLVVGSCAQGYPLNETADLLVSFTPIRNQCQYFWEAFPARDGRTTYLFTYLDADRQRLSLTELYEEYLQLLPEYQGISLEQLQWQRALFGLFPCYRRSPLRSPWSRVLHVGDSSGQQSPLSFGGFGAMMRHLRRLTEGIHSALAADALDRADLQLLQPYQPNLSVTWLFQRAMRVGINQTLKPDQINQLLGAIFAGMAEAGDPVLKPFLQDVVQFPALTQTLVSAALRHPGLIAQVIPQVGLPSLLDWMGHYVSLGVYSGLSTIAQPFQPAIEKLSNNPGFYWQQWLRAWQYGSGKDFAE